MPKLFPHTTPLFIRVIFDLIIYAGFWWLCSIDINMIIALLSQLHSASLWAHLCYSQVRDFKGPVCGQQQIPWFNVFVNDSLAVQIFKAIYKLAKVPGRSGGGEDKIKTKVKTCSWQQAHQTMHHAAQTNSYHSEAYSGGQTPTRSLVSYCSPAVLDLNLGLRNGFVEAESKYSRETEKRGERRTTWKTYPWAWNTGNLFSGTLSNISCIPQTQYSITIYVSWESRVFAQIKYVHAFRKMLY